jgi:hypothetical protein
MKRVIHEWHKNPEDIDKDLFTPLKDASSIEKLVFRDWYYQVAIGPYEYFKVDEITALYIYTFFSILVSIIWYNYT